MILNFAVLTKDVFLPRYPSITPIPLNKERPMVMDKNKGNRKMNSKKARNLFFARLSSDVK